MGKQACLLTCEDRSIFDQMSQEHETGNCRFCAPRYGIGAGFAMGCLDLGVTITMILCRGADLASLISYLFVWEQSVSCSATEQLCRIAILDSAEEAPYLSKHVLVAR